MTPVRLRSVCVALACALLVPGCGANDEEDVRSTVTSYFAALSDGDAGAACRALDPSLDGRIAEFARASYPDLGSTDCPAVLGQLLSDVDGRARSALGEVEVRQVQVQDDRANVQLAGREQRLQLRRSDDGWRISQLALGGATGNG